MTLALAAVALASAVAVALFGSRMTTRAVARAYPPAGGERLWRDGPQPCGCFAARRVDTGQCLAFRCGEHRPAAGPLPPDLARYDKELSA